MDSTPCSQSFSASWPAGATLGEVFTPTSCLRRGMLVPRACARLASRKGSRLCTLTALRGGVVPVVSALEPPQDICEVGRADAQRTYTSSIVFASGSCRARFACPAQRHRCRRWRCARRKRRSGAFLSQLQYSASFRRRQLERGHEVAYFVFCTCDAHCTFCVLCQPCDQAGGAKPAQQPPSISKVIGT